MNTFLEGLDQGSVKSNIVLSLLGQQQQFHFAFGQRPFPFATSDPLSGFRMPPIGNCNSKLQNALMSYVMLPLGPVAQTQIKFCVKLTVDVGSTNSNT